MMTEAQAWRQIAEDIHGSVELHGGLCRAVWHLLPYRPDADRRLRLRMLDRIEQALGRNTWAYRDTSWWYEGTPMPAWQREGRVLAALFFALMAEEEALTDVD